MPWEMMECGMQRADFFPYFFECFLEWLMNVRVEGGKEKWWRFGGSLVESQASRFQKTLNTRDVGVRSGIRIGLRAIEEGA